MSEPLDEWEAELIREQEARVAEADMRYRRARNAYRFALFAVALSAAAVVVNLGLLLGWW